MSLLERLRSYWPFGSSEPEEEPETDDRSLARQRERIEPPEEVLGVKYEPAGVHLSEFNSPATFDRNNIDIHCGSCDALYPSYWGWYDHASEEFGSLDEARDWATVLVPENEDIERIMASEPDTGAIGGSSGKPSPKDILGNDER